MTRCIGYKTQRLIKIHMTRCVQRSLLKSQRIQVLFHTGSHGRYACRQASSGQGTVPQSLMTRGWRGEGGGRGRQTSTKQQKARSAKQEARRLCPKTRAVNFKGTHLLKTSSVQQTRDKNLKSRNLFQNVPLVFYSVGRTTRMIRSLITHSNSNRIFSQTDAPSIDNLHMK